MFDVYDTTTQRQIAEAIALEAAAAMLTLDPDDVAWAIEEEGRCDVEEAFVLPHGVLPGSDPEEGC